MVKLYPSVFGHAGAYTLNPCEFLVKSGIDSTSVNPDVVNALKKMVAQIEQTNYA